MKYNLKPDPSLSVKHIRISGVPTLMLRPAQAAPIRVGILWIHGGGYITGRKEMVYKAAGADFVRNYRAIVFSPAYRLAWLHPYPAAVNDCFAVLDYMNSHKKDLGIDHLMVAGGSAGGGLCAAVCMMARDRGIHVDFQMPLYPMISNIDTDSSRDNHGKVWNTRRNHLGWRVYLRGNAKKAVSPYAAPAQQTDYSNLPPCYTFVADGEPFYAETLQYVQHLRDADVQADVDVYHTNVHAFDMQRPEEPISIQARSRLMDRFEQVLDEIGCV